MENPLIKLREEQNLLVSEFAVLANVSSTTVQKIENGTTRTIPEGVLQAVKHCGINPSQFESDFHTWRESRQNEIKEKLKN